MMVLVSVDLTAKQLSAILKASFGGDLTLKERQELGFVVIQARKRMGEVI